MKKTLLVLALAAMCGGCDCWSTLHQIAIHGLNILAGLGGANQLGLI